MRGLCPPSLRWGDVRIEGPTMVGERAQADSKPADAPERDPPPPAGCRLVLEKQLVHLHHWPGADGLEAKLCWERA